MPTVDFETSISDFLELGRRLQSIKPLTGVIVLEELTQWYRDVRVEGASFEMDDMLLLQWYEDKPLTLSEPTDIRGIQDGVLEYSETELPSLDFVRQVFVHGQYEDGEFEGEEIEFDDGAVQMSIALYYEQAMVEYPSSYLWIETPGEIGEKKSAYLATPFVAALINAPASKVVVHVGHCG
ncbi:MAG: hypothetical protein NT023_14630 [Armatimonadetes bacterium]|nr:hypothetical protein [Armatimonadota bacterium]